MTVGIGPLSSKILDLIGNTPLVDISSLNANPDIKILGKAEWFNPGGSVKDRAARAIVLDAEARGLLGPEKILLDATSGNTGIAYAMLGAARGFRVALAVPENINPERRRILLAHGADLIFTDPLEGSDGAIRRARELNANHPGSYYYADQYNNDSNWRAHFQTTGPEIWEQTAGEISHFIAGLGTSGTFVGTTRFLKKKNPNLHAVAVQPDSPMHGLEGMKHMATAIVPGIYDPSLADRQMQAATEDAYRMVLQLARRQGVLVGISAGAAVASALELAGGLRKGVIVVVLPDSGNRYLSESFWEEHDLH